MPPTVVFPGGVSPASDPTIVAQAAAAELIYVQSVEFLQGVAVPPSALRAVAEVGSVLVEFDGGELSGTVSKRSNFGNAVECCWALPGLHILN